MIIKAKQISEHLGISQATVSLAINNKPGVSAQTRQRILEYIDELKQNDTSTIVRTNRSIKVLSFMNERMLYDKEHAGFQSIILMELSKDAKEAGYNLILSYIHSDEELLEILEQSKHDSTCGFLLLAADMKEETLIPFEEIDIPLIICDYESENTKFDCVYNNNFHAVTLASNYLFSMGHQDIIYLKNSNTIYNFIRRREAYSSFVQEKGLDSCILEVGTKIDVIYDFMMDYLKNGEHIPTSFIAENYAISIATIKALQDSGYNIGEDMSIIGIDELPPYSLTNFKFTYIDVLFESKGRLAINRLLEKITRRPKETIRIVLENELVEGNSVKKLN